MKLSLGLAAAQEIWIHEKFISKIRNSICSRIFSEKLKLSKPNSIESSKINHATSETKSRLRIFLRREQETNQNKAKENHPQHKKSFPKLFIIKFDPIKS